MAEKDTQIEDLDTQLRTQKKTILEGEAQYLLENGLTKLFHSGFTPHHGEENVHFAWTNALSHAPDVGLSCVVVVACLLNSFLSSPVSSPVPLRLLFQGPELLRGKR